MNLTLLQRKCTIKKKIKIKSENENYYETVKTN